MTFTQAAALAVASVVAGAINSVAGGGSLISFPTSVAVGLTPLVANATNAVSLSPGSVASGFAYRRELRQDWAILRIFLPPAALGGILGAILLLVTPQKLFDAIVPFLILFATVLLFAQNLRRAAGEQADPDAPWRVPQRPIVAMLLQLLVGVYGGYFGAGMGIMMLAVFTRMGGTNIHRMNAVKTVLGAVINAIASVAFVIAGTVDYHAAGVMAVGAIIGGFLGAAGARRVKPSMVRWGVVAIGLVLTVLLGYRRWFAHHA